MRIKLVLFIFTTCFCNFAFSDNLNIQINPLVNYSQQIKQIRKECGALGFPEECKMRLDTLSKEMDTLRRYCQKNYNDYRCDALEKKSTEAVDPLEELCFKDPYASKCVNKRETRRQNALLLAKYCRSRPESSRCKPPAPPKKREPYLVSFCRKSPKAKMCVKYLEEEKLRKDPFYKEDKQNVF